MPTITVVNKRIHRETPHTVYCGRPGPLGNPFVVGRDGERGECARKFAAYLETHELPAETKEALAELQRRHDAGEPLELMCWCAPDDCHATHIAKFIDKGQARQFLAQASPIQPEPGKPVAVVYNPKRPDKPTRYHDLATAHAKIAEALQRGGYRAIAVVGSRELAPADEYTTASCDREEYHRIDRKLRQLAHLAGIPLERVCIISGGARGVDTLAREYAYDNRLPYVEFPADWDRQGKQAGFLRNAEIVKACHEVVALPRKERRGSEEIPAEESGTMDTVRQARLMGKPVSIL